MAQPITRFTATFPKAFLHACLNALPRPWIEKLIWFPVLALFLLSIVLAVFMGSMDGLCVYAAHLKFRTELNKLDCNATPNPTRVFRFERTASDTNPTEPDVSSSGSMNSKRSTESNFMHQSVKKNITAQTSVPSPALSMCAVLNRLERIVLLLSRIFYHSIRTFLSTLRLAKSATLFLLRYIRIVFSKVLERSSTSEAMLPALNKKSKKSSSNSHVDILKPRPSETCENVGESDGDSGRMRNGGSSKVFTTKTVSTRLPQTKQPNVDDSKPKSHNKKADTSRWNTVPDSTKQSAKRKKLYKVDPVTASWDSRSPSRTVDFDLSTDNVQGPGTQHRSTENTAPMTEAGIAAAVRATKKLTEDLSLQARKKVVQSKQNARPKYTNSYTPTTSSSGPDHESKASPTNTLKKSTNRNSAVVKTKLKCSHSNGTHSQVEQTTNHQKDVSLGKRKSVFHLPPQSRVSLMDYLPTTDSGMFSPSVNPLKYNDLQPEYEFCWSLPQHPATGANFRQPIQISSPNELFSPLSFPWDGTMTDMRNAWQQDACDWNDDALALRGSPDSAMDQIAADSKAFGESLLQCALKNPPKQCVPVSVDTVFGSEESMTTTAASGNETVASPSLVQQLRFGTLNPWLLDFNPLTGWHSSTQSVLSKDSYNDPLLSDSVISNSVAAFNQNEHQKQSSPTLSVLNNISTPVPDTGEAADVNRSDHADEFGPFHTSNSWVTAVNTAPHCMYELPQITQARRQSMLEHEGKMLMDESCWYNITGLESSSDSEEIQPKSTNPADGSSITGSIPALPSMMVSKQTTNEHHLTASMDVIPNQVISSDLPYPAPSGQSPSALVDKVTYKAQESSQLPSFQAWAPLSAIANDDLLRELGLDETDRVLSFGPSFSYHDWDKLDPVTHFSIVQSSWRQSKTGAEPIVEKQTWQHVDME